VTVALPLAPMVPAGAAVGDLATPPTWTEQPVTATFEVPVLVNTTMQVSVVPVQDVTCALTCAELVNDPNRPKTNPAMATAAMRVMAMRMTVASTGEMAFLFFLRTFSKFIVGPKARWFVYKSRMEYPSSFPSRI